MHVSNIPSCSSHTKAITGAMVGLQIFARPRVSPAAKEEQTEKPSASAPRGQPPLTEVVVRVSTGRWAGDHKAVVLQKGRTQSTRKKLTATEELQQLQGMWELKDLVSKGSKERLPPDKAEAKIYVRGKRVEESTADGHRRFFNLVLAEKARDPTCTELASKGGCARGTKRPRQEDLDGDRRDQRHALPPLQGPHTLENVKNVRQKAAKAKGKGKQAGKMHVPGHWMLLHHTPKLLILRDGFSAEDPLWWHPEEQAAWSRGGHSEESLTVRWAVTKWRQFCVGASCWYSIACISICGS